MLLTNIIFPQKCGLCGKIGSYLCEDCKRQLDKYKINKIETKDGMKKFYVYKYKNTIRKLIIKYKFQDCAYLYKTFEKMLLNDEKLCRFLKSYDIIIPVPIHNKRKKERGYNQSSLIARKVAKSLKIEYCELLEKTSNTTPQSKLTKEQRMQNAKGVYKINQSINTKIVSKKILIFDDIYTTGSTTKECAKILWQDKPKEIGIITIAKD